MTCNVCRRLIFELVDGALRASKEEQVLAHARTCQACGKFLEAERARVNSLPQTLDCAALGGKLPPAAVERFLRHMDAPAKELRSKRDRRSSS